MFPSKRSTLFILAVVSFIFISAYKNEPQGFRDVKWGQAKEELKGLELVRQDSTGGEVYTRKGDKLQFGNAQLQSIEYGFCQNRLCVVKIYAKDYNNFCIIQGILEKKYGRAFKPDPDKDEYFWVGDITDIKLDFFSARTSGVVGAPFTLWFGSEEILKQAEVWSKEQANPSPTPTPNPAPAPQPAPEPSPTPPPTPAPQPASEPPKPTAVKILSCEVKPYRFTDGKYKGQIRVIAVTCTYQHPYKAIVGADLHVTFYDRFQDSITWIDNKNTYYLPRGSECTAYASLFLEGNNYDISQFFQVVNEFTDGRLLIEAELQRLVLDDGTIIRSDNYGPIDTWRNFTPKK
jgi:hypothetical protein